MDKDDNKYKLIRYFKQFPIPGYIKIDDNIFADVRILLIIEKYYLNQKTDNQNAFSEVIQELSEVLENTDKHQDYPKNLQQPIFDPTIYPRLLKLYSHFFEKCYDYRNLHSLAGNYYNNLGKKFTNPTILLSALSSITSFITGSSIFGEKTKIALNILVGTMSSFSAMLQAFNSAYQLDLKSNSHFKSADDYDHLITQIDFEKNFPVHKDFFQNLEKKLLEIKTNNPFLIPNFIKTKYYMSKDKASYLDFY